MLKTALQYFYCLTTVDLKVIVDDFSIRLELVLILDYASCC